MANIEFLFDSNDSKSAQNLKHYVTRKPLLCAFTDMGFLRPRRCKIFVFVLDIWKWFEDTTVEDLVEDMAWVVVHELIHTFNIDHLVSDEGWTFI